MAIEDEYDNFYHSGMPVRVEWVGSSTMLLVLIQFSEPKARIVYRKTPA